METITLNQEITISDQATKLNELTNNLETLLTNATTKKVVTYSDQDIDVYIIKNFEYVVANKSEVAKMFNVVTQKISARCIKLHADKVIPYAKTPRNFVCSDKYLNSICDFVLENYKSKSNDNCMGQYNNHFGTNKDFVRRRIARRMVDTRMHGTMVGLSSTNAITEKYINTLMDGMEFLAVERSKETFDKMGKIFQRSEMFITSHHGDIFDVLKNSKSNSFAHANIDLMGTLSHEYPKLVNALKGDVIKKNGIVAFTFQYNSRGAKVYDQNETNQEKVEATRIINLVNSYSQTDLFLFMANSQNNMTKTQIGNHIFLATNVPSGYKLLEVNFYKDGSSMCQAIYQKL
jgi:hypothetical protein